ATAFSCRLEDVLRPGPRGVISSEVACGFLLLLLLCASKLQPARELNSAATRKHNSTFVLNLIPLLLQDSLGPGALRLEGGAQLSSPTWQVPFQDANPNPAQTPRLGINLQAKSEKLCCLSDKIVILSTIYECGYLPKARTSPGSSQHLLPQRFGVPIASPRRGGVCPVVSILGSEVADESEFETSPSRLPSGCDRRSSHVDRRRLLDDEDCTCRG